MTLDPYQQHPSWAELEMLCSKIEKLKEKAKKLREEINKDVFVELSQKAGGKE